MSEKTIRIEAEITATDKTGSAFSSVEKKIKSLSSGTSKFFDSSQKTAKSLGDWTKQKYQFVLEAKDKVGPIVSDIGGNLKSFAGKTWSTTMKIVDMATAPLRGIIDLLKNPILQVGAVLGISTSIGDVINTYKDFQSQMSQVQAISGADGSQLEALTAKAKEMGASTKFTAEEAAQGFNYMAMAGWDTEDMLNGISGVLSLAAASGEDLGKTSDIVTDALTAFGMKASDATHFADVLAVASSNANTNVGMMGETFKYVGAASGALGYSIEDVALGIGLMANAGIKSSQAGTELNSIFTRLSTNTSGARDAIEALGISFYDEKGNARAFGTVLEELREATKGMNNEQKINLANTIAGQRAQAGLLAMLNATETDYNKVADAIRNADGAAADMSDTMMNNMQGAITKLQSAFDGVKLAAGERLAPYITKLAEYLTEQMPKITAVIDSVMDRFDLMAQRIKSRWQEMTGSMEWKDADFLGKIKIAWDKMIIEPLSEWWNGTGKAKVAHFAGEFGNFLGTALNMGIMGLFGFDTGGAIDEGASIGKSFAKGFAEGFDFKAVASKVMQGIGNIFKSALKLLPGGDSPGLSSLLSAGLIAKGAATIGSPLISLGKAGVGMGRLAKTVFGSGKQTLVQNSDGTLTSVGSTGLGLGSKILGLGTKAYGALTGGAGTLSGGAASAMGLAGVTGAVMGGVGIVSGGLDVYRAIKADDEKAKAAYGKSAGWKLGGVAAGAGIGTAILPGLGTAIGAGVGAIGGLIMGNREKKKYEEEMERLSIRREKTAEAYKLTGVAMDKVVFKSKELNEALDNSEMTAEEFSYLLQSDMAQKAQSAFGSIKLSLSEVDKLAEKITFGKQKSAFDSFNKAALETQSALASYENAQADMKEMTWKVGLGMELSGDDISDFKASVENYVSSAKTYVEKSQYEATLGMKLIMGDSADTSVIDGYYGKVQSRLDELSKELDNRIEIALEGDFRIDADEAKAINEVQNEIAEITNRISQAKQEAQLEAIKIKYSGAELDYESFTMLQEELSKFKEEAESTLSNEYISARTSLKLALEDADTEEAKAEIRRQIDELDEGYSLRLQEIDVSVGSFGLETIATAWEDELNVAFAGMEGTVQENLSSILNKALAVKPDVEAWTQNDIISWFGLDKLGDASTAGLIAEQVKTIASQVSSGSKEAIVQGLTESMPTAGEIMESMNSVLGSGSFSEAGGIFSKVAESMQKMLSDNVSNIDFDGTVLNLGVKYSTAIQKQDIAGSIREALNSNLSEAQLFDTLGEIMQAAAEGVDVSEYMSAITDKFKEADIDIKGSLDEALKTNFEEADLFASLGEIIMLQADGVDVSEFMEPLLSKFQEAEIDLTPVKEALAEQFTTMFDDFSLAENEALLENISMQLQEALDGAAGDINTEQFMSNLSEALAVLDEGANIDTTALLESINTELQEMINEAGSDIEATELAARISETIQSSIPPEAFSEVGESVRTNLEASLSAIGDIDASGIIEATRGSIESGVSSGVTSVDYAGMMAPLGANISQAAGAAVLSADNSPVQSAASSKMGEWKGIVQSQTGAGISTTMPINVTANWNLLNPTHTFAVSGDGGGSATINVSAHAAGGYVSGGPQLSWLAEEGWGEYIIPTNPSRRADALKLLEKAGQALGITNISEISNSTSYEHTGSISAHAAGGYVSGMRDRANTRNENLRTGYADNAITDNVIRLSDYSEAVKSFESRHTAKDLKEKVLESRLTKEYNDEGRYFSESIKEPQSIEYDTTASDTESTELSSVSQEPAYNATVAEKESGAGETNVNVNINMTPEFNINGAADTSEILDTIRANMRQMVDEMSAGMAQNLKEVFSNKPRKRA